MIDSDDKPGVIDFQDSVTGPVSYDLVSLLKDCYIRWPGAQRASWLRYYLETAARRGVRTGSRAAFEAGFRRVGIQRHLKVLGIFSRLSYRDKKNQYLNDIPMVYDYLVDALRQEPELGSLAALLARLAPPPGGAD